MARLAFVFLWSFLLFNYIWSPLFVLAAGSNRQTMILPLFPSSSSSSTRTSWFSGDGKSRRHLHTSDAPGPNARMALHDDLISDGYFTTSLWIGSPPQKFALIVDTGSTVTYVPCSTCQRCGSNHQGPKFNPSLSSTYQLLKCNTRCICNNATQQCSYERQYAEMSTSSGVLGKDYISFGNLGDVKPQRSIFGCENVETGYLYSQHADGIMGLGRGDPSIVDQLVNKGVISDSFSLCYGGMDTGGGAMVLGGISPPPEMVYAYSDPARSPYYNIKLMGLNVAGKQLPVSPSVFDGRFGTILDSGTTYAFLPEAAFLAFKNAVIKELHNVKQIDGPDPRYNDICFSSTKREHGSQLLDTFPTVEMVFGKGQQLSLTPENYLFPHSTVAGAYCLGIFQNGKATTTLLGGILFRNTLVMYDREHNAIGFWKTNCSDLWGRLDALTGDISPSSAPNASSGDMSPSSAPNNISPGPGNVASGSIDVEGRFILLLLIALGMNFVFIE